MWRGWLAALLVGAGPVFVASGQTELGRFEPATGCYLGAYVELDPAVRGDLYAWEELTGRRHASYLTYVGYGVPFPSDWARKLVAREIRCTKLDNVFAWIEDLSQAQRLANRFSQLDRPRVDADRKLTHLQR